MNQFWSKISSPLKYYLQSINWGLGVGEVKYKNIIENCQNFYFPPYPYIKDIIKKSLFV